MPRYTKKEFTEAAAMMRRLLEAFPAKGEDTHSRAMRRRMEGSISTLEALAGKGPSTESNDPSGPT
jgi:hypothetical protein